MNLGNISRMKIDERGMAYLEKQLMRHFEKGEFGDAIAVNEIIYQQVFGMYSHVREQIRRIKSDEGKANRKEKSDLLKRLMVLEREIRDNLNKYEDLGNELTVLDDTQNNDKEEA